MSVYVDTTRTRILFIFMLILYASFQRASCIIPLWWRNIATHPSSWRRISSPKWSHLKCKSYFVYLLNKPLGANGNDSRRGDRWIRKPVFRIFPDNAPGKRIPEIRTKELGTRGRLGRSSCGTIFPAPENESRRVIILRIETESFSSLNCLKCPSSLSHKNRFSH